MTPTEIAAGLSSLEKELLLGNAPSWGSWMFECGEGLVAKGLGTKRNGSISFDTALADEVIRILRKQQGRLPVKNEFRPCVHDPLSQRDTECLECYVSKVPPAPADIQVTLAERGTRYGEFKDQAVFAQGFAEVARVGGRWERLAPDQREALSVIFNKVARILNGDPDYSDSWHDIAGYATLVDVRLKAEGK